MTSQSTSFRTYRFGSKGRQALDSASIMMPGVSKSKIANAAVFHLIYDINQAMAANPKLNVRAAFEEVIDPIREITYEDLLKAVTPTSRDQTPLDDYIGVRIIKTVRSTGEVLADVSEDMTENRDGDDEDEEFLSYLFDEDESGDSTDPGDGKEAE